MSINLETDVPVPVNTRRNRSKYPFDLMEVGNSFHVDGDPRLVEGALRNVAYRWQKANPGVRFTIRSDETGARVWRIA